MASTRGATASPRSQRRRAEIVDAASALFFELGYHRVGMDEVAAKVGITGGALYKHVAGKQDLLAQAVSGALAPLEAAIDGATDLATAVEALAAVVTDVRRTGILVTREVRPLAGAALAAILERVSAFRRTITGLVATRRPDLSPLDTRLLGDMVLALLCSPAHHTIALPRERSIRLLATMSTRIVAIEVPPADADGNGAGTADGRRGASLVQRREQLIDAAIELFGRRGYWAATMGDLGAAADIAGPSIYQHFSSKADLLVAALTRGNEALRLGLSRAFAEGHDAASTLVLLVDSYVDLVLGHNGLIDLLISETLYLPELERASLRGMQHRYVGEWVNLVQATHPGLDHPTARFLTHAVLSVVNLRGPGGPEDAARRRQLLVAVSRDLLLTPRWAEELAP